MIYAIYICDNTTIANSQFDYADLPESGYIRICTNEIYLDFAETFDTVHDQNFLPQCVVIGNLF